VLVDEPALAAEPRIRAKPTLPPRAYTDGTGTVLEFVAVSVRDSSGVHAIIRLSGVGELYEGRAMLATRSLSPNGASEWSVKIDGGSRIILEISTKRVSTGTIALKAGGYRDKRILSHDVESSQHVDATEVLASYRQAVDSGEVAKFETLNREAHIARGRAALEIEQERFHKACKTSIPIEIAWDEVPDEMAGRQHYCHVVVHQLALLCGRNQNNKADLAAKVSKISCDRDPTESLLALTESGTLEIHRPKEGGLHESKATEALTKVIDLKRTVLRSSAGSYAVISYDASLTPLLHAGWAPNLHRQSLSSFTLNSAGGIWHADQDISLVRGKGGTWVADCPVAPLRFDEVSVEERDRFLDTATFGKRLWRREDFALARDTVGTYYYIDKLTRAEGNLGHRLFRGPRGAVKQVDLKDVITDAQSIIFVTKNSRFEVRMRGANVDSAHRRKGKRYEKLQLLTLGSSKNRSLVFNELGVYDGETFGILCELGTGPQP
jgi:hypothetical protein